MSEAIKVVPEQINFLYPSTAKDLIGCEYRFACKSDPDVKRYERGNTATALGSVVHEIKDLLHKRKIFESGYVDEEFEELWERLITDQYLSLKQEWDPSVVPKPNNWANYVWEKATTRKYVRDTLNTLDVTLGSLHEEEDEELREREGRASHEIPEDPQSMSYEQQLKNPVNADLSMYPDTEVELVDNEFMIRGEIDLIERSDNDDIYIIDTKTGNVTEDNVEKHRIQLLLYAHLFFKKHEIWPRKLFIESKLGKRYELSYEVTEVQRLIDDLILLRDSFNRKAGSATNDFQSNPSPELCKYCAFRIVCNSYWDALHDDWGHRDALMGKLSEDNQGPDKFEVLAPSEGVYDTVSIAKMPAIQSESDKYIYITKFQKKGNRIEPKWNTLARYSS